MARQQLKSSAWSSRPRWVLVLLGVLVILAGSVFGVVSAFAYSGPSVSSFTLVGSSPTNAASVSWKLVFSESVTGVVASDFTFVPSAGLSGYGPVLVSGSGSTYTVSATTGSGDGTLGLNLSVGSIKDSSNRVLQGGSTGPVFTIDKTPPVVSSISLAGSSPTNAASVSWNVVFSESVIGVAASDFAVVAGGGLGGSPAVTGVTGSGASYTVTASSGSGNGTLALNLSLAGSITDAAGNALTLGPQDNGPAYTFTQPAYSLFAADAACGSAGITVSGSKDVIGGATHSNSSYIVSGANNTFGNSDAGCTPNISGSGNTFGRNSASAPSAGPKSLPYPEPYNAATVCSQPGVHTGTSISFTNGTPPSGIYCYSSQITLSGNNVTANVTFVAPLIQISGSSLILSPAYGNLVAYDTSTTLGNNGFQMSGSKDDLFGTVYDPYGALMLSGSNTKIDGFFEADTITLTGSSLDVIGNLSLSGNASGLLYPLPASGPATGIPLTFNNPNSTAQTVTSLSITIPVAPPGCPTGDFTISYGASPISASNPLTVPANGSVTLPSGTVSEPTILLVENGLPEDCEGATFTLDYTATGSNPGTGTATVGFKTPFTISFGTTTGGLLMPTSATDPNKTVDTVQVKLTNNDPGDEYLHQITYEITPGWQKASGGPIPCTASDFSIDGLAANTPDTVIYNQTIPPGGSVTGSFTIQMINRSDTHPGNGTGNQDACEGATPSITVNAT